MDITKLTTTELEALAYRILKQRALADQNMRTIEAELGNRAEKRAVDEYSNAPATDDEGAQDEKA